MVGCILAVAMYGPVVGGLWAVVVDLSITVGMLAIVLVASIIRYASAAIVDGGIMAIDGCWAAIVGAVLLDEVCIVDVYVANLLEEVGFHHGASKNKRRAKGPIYPTWGQCGHNI